MTGTIGFVGQGFIGKHMADDFEERGYTVVRYALEEPYIQNRDAIAECAVVFIAVPTPSTPQGFDASVVEKVLTLVGEDKIAVIKSSIVPGTTRRLQAQFPHLTIVHAPEFLREKSAALDTRKPERTIIGLPEMSDRHNKAADLLLSLLPVAPYTKVCTAEEAELIKYGGNCFLATKVVYMNVLYDLAQVTGASYEVVAEAMGMDPRIGTSHMRVVDQSGHPSAVPGRGAGGHCFPKDLAALCDFYDAVAGDPTGSALLRSLESKNNELLRASGKDLEILNGIYGTTP